MNIPKHDKNIDYYFKLSNKQIHIDFDKNKSWQKLIHKRNKKKMITLSIAASVTIIFGLLIPTVFQLSHEAIIPNEAFKRKKLEEYERKMAGTYEDTEFCFDCNGLLFKTEKKQAPDYQYIQMIY